MNKSYKIIRNSLLIGVLGGVLVTVVVLYLGLRKEQAIRWSKIPSPPEEIGAILQIGREGWVLVSAAKSGNTYSCSQSGEPCRLGGKLSQDAIDSLDICENQQINDDDEDFHAPPAQTGQIIDTCKDTIHSEIVSTYFLLLYEDNSLWVGKFG